MASRQARVAHAAVAAEPAPRFGRAALRQALPLPLAAVFVLLLHDRIAAIDAAEILAALGRIGAGQWAVAAIATSASFAAIGQYDVTVHRLLRTGVRARSARRAGLAGIAISQVLGFGLITGALVRWRLLPGLSLWQAARLTGVVALLFILCWATVTAAAVVALPAAAGPLAGAPARAAALAVLALAAGGVAAAFLRPRPTVFGRRIEVPPLPAIGRLLLLTAADTGAAALALWALLPEGAGTGAAALVPAYLVALGAGLILATPGGIGPFELALAALLPGTGQEGLLAAVLAFRLVYFACPASVAAAAVLLGPRAEVPDRAALEVTLEPCGRLAPAELSARLGGAARAECRLAHQGLHDLLLSARSGNGWLVGRGGQALVGLFDPLRPDADTARLIGALRDAARAEGRIPCLYKIGRRTALRARRAGWTVLPVADEAWLDPRRFAPVAPDHAGLRRKLGKAARAGVEIACPAPEDLPLAEMAALARAWAAARGGERGFSMGRFAPGYVAAQRVYLAKVSGRLVAFASFHEGAREWVLDLMRPGRDAPDGTMHALIAAALDDARAAGLPRLSLAALPCRACDLAGPVAPVFALIGARRRPAGLARFKTGFAPARERLYIAAPGAFALALAAADIAREIRAPRPLPAPPRRAAASEPVPDAA